MTGRSLQGNRTEGLDVEAQLSPTSLHTSGWRLKEPEAWKETAGMVGVGGGEGVGGLQEATCP